MTQTKQCPLKFKHLPTGEIFDCCGNDGGYYWAEDPDSPLGLLKFEQSECQEITSLAEPTADCTISQEEIKQLRQELQIREYLQNAAQLQPTYREMTPLNETPQQFYARLHSLAAALYNDFEPRRVGKEFCQTQYYLGMVDGYKLCQDDTKARTPSPDVEAKTEEKQEWIDEVEEAKTLFLKKFPTGEFGEDEDCEIIYNVLKKAGEMCQASPQDAALPDVEAMAEALDACFGVMMQPGWYDTLDGDKKFSVWATDTFIEARKKAEKMYYEVKAAQASQPQDAAPKAEWTNEGINYPKDGIISPETWIEDAAQVQDHGSKVDLHKLRAKFDSLFENETIESFNEWLCSQLSAKDEEIKRLRDAMQSFASAPKTKEGSHE